MQANYEIHMFLFYKLQANYEIHMFPFYKHPLVFDQGLRLLKLLVFEVRVAYKNCLEFAVYACMAVRPYVAMYVCMYLCKVSPPDISM